MKKILVTGGHSQLAKSLRDRIPASNPDQYYFEDIDTLDITDDTQLIQYFKSKRITHCINCAAFTAVDLAETQQEAAFKVNVEGAVSLANVCLANNAALIHISTDFVFDGTKSTPYTEVDLPNPLSVYGKTKLEGEKGVAACTPSHFIIRTSWLFSEYGKNFVKTMLQLGLSRDSVRVISDQVGSPTYAGDLADFIMHLVQSRSTAFGTYHFSNEGVASWYDFAKAVFEIAQLKTLCIPIPASEYPTPAIRPSFSVMDKCKSRKITGQDIPYWRDSLKKCLNHLIEE